MKSFFRIFIFVAATILFTSLGFSQILVGGKPVQFLWPTRKAPFPIPKPSYLDTSYTMTDTTKNSWLVVYQATTNPNGAGIVLMPGGGYRNLAGWPTEGLQGAAKLNSYGITVFILHYRFNPNGTTFQHPCEMWDAQRSVRWARAHAAQYGVDPNRLGVLGFSSGGHQASTVSTHYDAGLTDTTSPLWYPGLHDSVDLVSCKPAFQALVYPMTTMVQYVPGTTNTQFAYADGRTALLGSNPSQTLVDYMSNEKQVTPNTPRTWINWGTTDNLVNPLNSTVYRDSLTTKGVVVKTVPVNTSTHGYSTARLDSLATWLSQQGFLTPTAINPRNIRHAFSSSSVGSGKDLDALGRFSNQPHGFELKALPIKE